MAKRTETSTKPATSAGIDRRGFLKGAVAGMAAATTVGSRAASQAAPEVITPSSARPLVISSGNGNRYTHDGSMTAVEKTFERMTAGEDVLDAVIAGVNILELDPEDTSVGYGGLPNADGVVQLDSCCMHGPRRQAGGVAALEGVRTPSSVAKAVMEHTDHHLLVGAGAQTFARNLGFEIEDDLNTDTSRQKWLEWKRRTDPGHYLDPEERIAAGQRAALQMVDEGLLDEESLYGTINCNAIDARGDICGVTTTSGLAWKIPGRVGDSPILGAGLYVDNAVGAAGSTGRGEANLFNLCSFLIVEEMRRGKHPKDAGMMALERIRESTVEKRLLNERGLPNFSVKFYILDKQGRWAGVGMYRTERATFALCTENGAETLPIEPLLEGHPRDEEG